MLGIGYEQSSPDPVGVRSQGHNGFRGFDDFDL